MKEFWIRIISTLTVAHRLFGELDKKPEWQQESEGMVKSISYYPNEQQAQMLLYIKEQLIKDKTAELEAIQARKENILKTLREING